jgi:type I restriction-modification system DNA methylase subunit
MPPKQYTCNTCKEVFIKKSDYTKHKNCLTKIKEVNMNNCTDNKSVLINLFKNCLNILRDNEGLTGEKALRNMSYLLILKLLEPRLTEIGIDNYNYDFSEYDDDVIEKYKSKLFGMVRFSNLANEKEDNIKRYIKPLWDDILSVHPTTKNIFLKSTFFDIQRNSTYKNLIDKINLLDLSHIEYDILGNAYEEVIQDIMTGKVLGQFFTPPVVKKLMVQLIDPQVYSDGTIQTCCDPTMGTGGFLITYLKYIQQKSNNLDWKFIRTEGLYGKELEPDTYQLAVSNMLISSGHMFEGLVRGDSIREPITRKFDNILANPPFGIKGLKYDEIKDPLKDEYIPIKSDNAVSLFIQAIIYMLKVGGRCAIVLPDGQDLFSKNNKILIMIREYLLKTCDLQEIIYMPSGTFTYTSIKTCIFYFIKKVEGSDVLGLTTKKSKAEKETRTYKFIDIHQTNTVKFYDYTTTKTLLTEVPIEKIAGNSYSLKYSDYIETIERQYKEGIVTKTLGEICEFLPKSKRQASYGNKEGPYPFYTSSQTCSKYCDVPDYIEECIIIGTGGNANIKYSSKFSCSTDNYIIKINTICLTKYVYYYLLNNIEILQNGFIGVGISHISKDYISNIKIPVPSLDRQEEIVKYCDHTETLIRQLEERIEDNKKQAIGYIKNILK